MLRRLFDLYMKKASIEFTNYCNMSCSKKFYGYILANTYAYVSWSVPTVETVVTGVPNHPLADALRLAAEEEVGHELIVLDDLKSLGYTFEQFTVSPCIDKFIERQREILNNTDPVSTLLGRMYVLEGMQPHRQQIDNIVANYDIKPDEASALYLHAEVDIGHSIKIQEMLCSKSIDEDVVLCAAIDVAQLFERHWRWMSEHVEV